MAKEKQILHLNMQAFDEGWMRNYAYVHLKENTSPVPWKNELMSFIIDWLSGSDNIGTLTSGSTGTPKKIKLQKKFMEVSAQATLVFFVLKPGDKVLLCLPITYIAAKMMVVRAFVGKLDLYCVPPSLNPVNEWTPKLDFAALTPAQLSKLMESREGIDFVKSTKKIILGGGPIPTTMEVKIQELDTQIWHTYGMTETMSHIAIRKVNGSDKSNYFYPMPGVQIQKNAADCLTITAPHIGLFKLGTNDLAEIQDDGGFRILGRKDHVVNSGGVKLFPEQIERKLSGIIQQSFYAGSLPDTRLGEKLVLFIESEEPEAGEKQKLKAILKKNLSGYEVPKEICFIKKFKRTESGKIIRGQGKH